jgi:hypothetical protein
MRSCAGDPGIAQPAQAMLMVRGRRGAGVIDHDRPVARGRQAEGGVGNADIGFQADQHELIAPSRGGGIDRGADVRLIAEAEDHLVEHGRAGRQFSRQVRHQRPVARDILRRGDDRDIEEPRRLHQPGHAAQQRFAVLQRQLVKKILLDVDDQKAGPRPFDEPGPVVIHVIFHRGHNRTRYTLSLDAPAP